MPIFKMVRRPLQSFPLQRLYLTRSPGKNQKKTPKQTLIKPPKTNVK